MCASRCEGVCVCGRCHVVSQFNDGLYDLIIAADETSLDDPRTIKPDTSKDTDSRKHKLVLRCRISQTVAPLVL